MKSLSPGTKLEPSVSTEPTSPAKGRLVLYHGRDATLFVPSLIGTVVLVVLVVTLLTPAYHTNDDFAMRTIASGLRTGEPSQHLIFISVLVGALLQALYKSWPSIFWYDLMLYFCLVAAGTTATYALLRQRARESGLALAVPLLFLAIAALEPSFTIISGLCAGAAVLLLVSAWLHAPRNFAGQLVAGALVILCTVLGVLLRYNQAILVIATGLVGAFPLLIYERRQAPLLWAAACAACILITIFATMTLSHLIGQDPEYKSYYEYSNARSTVQEYYMPLDWNIPAHRTALQQVGWNGWDYQMFMDWFTTNRELYNTETLNRLAEVAAFSKRTTSASETLVAARRQVCTLWAEYRFFGLALLALIPLFSAWRRGLAAYAAGGASFIASSVVIAVLYKQAPQRVTFSLAFVWLAVAALSALNAPPSGTGTANKLLYRWFAAVCIMAFLFFSAPLVEAIATTSQGNRKEAAVVAEDFQRYSPPETRVHVWWRSPLNAEFLLLPFKELQVPFNWIGLGWVINSPLGTAQLRRWSVGLLEQDVCRRPEFALIADKEVLSDLSGFLRSRYGMSVRFEEIFRGERLSVYRCSEAAQ